ncbi:MAG: M16 family metallopeptidase [Alphaproteobacteria bacterium]
MLFRSAAFAAALAVAALWVSPAPAKIELAQFTLSNGMQVVVIPDRRAPVVTHMLWYRVGGTDDPRGHSGLAHFFEHLMFRGTKTVPPGEMSKIVARNGGQDNAFTTHDYTAYFQRVARDKLPLMMELEADRMINLNLSEKNVVTERSVVQEERRSRVDSDPTSQLQERMMAELYLPHPYGRPVIGWAKEIAKIGRKEAIAYYTHHYAPNNAILIVVGDVTPSAALKLAQERYGRVPKRELAARTAVPQPPRRSESRMTMTHPDVRLPIFMCMYRVPSYRTAQRGAAESLELLAEILGGGTASRLYQSLVVKKKVAVTVGAWYSGYTRDAAQFGVYAYPREDVSLAEVEKAVDEVLAAIGAAPPDAEEFARAKTKLVAQAIYSRDNQAGLANIYGAALAIGLTPKDVDEWPNRIEAVPRNAPQAAARNYLVRRESVTGWLLPRER